MHKQGIEKLILSIIFGTIGTVLFFYSVMSILASRIENKKKLYYKSLNIFTVKQIKSKINTNFLSISVICLMLFVTISVLSLSIGFKNRELDKFAPFDATIGIAGDEIERTEKLFGIPKDILEKRIELKYIGTGRYNKWRDEEIFSFNEILAPYADNVFKNDFAYENYGPQVISLSDYNKLLEIQGRKEINLKEEEYLLISTDNSVKDDLERFLKKNNGVVKVNEKRYVAKDNEIVMEQIENTVSNGGRIMLIVGQDEWVEKEEAFIAYYNINYNQIEKESREYIERLFKDDNHQNIKQG